MPDGERRDAERVAAIDVGSNSMHLLVADVHPSGRIDVVDRLKRMIKLGADTFAQGYLDRAARQRAASTYGEIVQLARSHHVDRIVAAATSAVREAENGSRVLDKLEREAGISVDLLSGKQEAELIFEGVLRSLRPSSERLLVIDIGGGSIELMVGDGAGAAEAESYRLGVQRLLAELGDAKGENARRALGERVRATCARMIDAARSGEFDRCVGTSGTIEQVAELARQLSGKPAWRRPHGAQISIEELRAAVDALWEMAPDERVAAGIDEKRADAIHLGGQVLLELMAATDADELTLCEGSLREGLIARAAGARVRNSGDARRDAVCDLVRRCGRDTARSEHVARLAGQLFDALADVHGCDEDERELAEHAARLHDIGRFIAHKRYHKHSRYLVLQSRLAGFSDEDQTVLAHVARYHRKAAPEKGQKKFSRLDERSRERVRALSAIVRAAVALDRGHSEAVERVERAPGAESEGPTFVSVHLRDEARVERAAFDRALLVVEDTFSRAVRPEYRIRERGSGD